MEFFRLRPTGDSLSGSQGSRCEKDRFESNFLPGLKNPKACILSLWAGMIHARTLRINLEGEWDCKNRGRK